MTGDSHNVRLSGEGRVGEVASKPQTSLSKKFAEFNSALAKERWSDAQKAEIFRPYLAEKLAHRYCTCLKISSSICSVNLPSENATTLLTGISFRKAIVARSAFFLAASSLGVRSTGFSSCSSVSSKPTALIS